MRSVPRHRSIIAIDIERSTSPARTNPIREELRNEAYRLLGTAMRTAGISDGHCDPLADRGDGVLALIHPADEVPKTLLLNPLVPVLVTLLAERNASLGTAERYRRELRLRVVIHAGEIHYDGKGYFGEALDVAFRLLDAPRLKDRLRHTMTPLVPGSCRRTSTGPSCSTSTMASPEAPSSHWSGSQWRAGGGGAGCTSPLPG